MGNHDYSAFRNCCRVPSIPRHSADSPIMLAFFLSHCRRLWGVTKFTFTLEVFTHRSSSFLGQLLQVGPDPHLQSMTSFLSHAIPVGKGTSPVIQKAR